ncbi:S-methyl-5-thioribose kinase [Pseudonocardia asaccharolytica]|uniref:S-methyl-5-thioribose kinase n=1 Tax=Pseudonocardia asaccharolytica DSM 44247 = NBRC 16224 TaxID=1123024 RepID=A0A511D5Q5_9PSEU|nr:S-methyl-5-thioribose kinase [Pseudonocardia asaccharolytica]GEL20115.1 methylthioribose kinase [Pseudonocardia asaccharolytica DSM 44247 = NBRC 16224]
MADAVLTVDEVPRYIAGRAVLRELVDPGTLTVSEIGDGNLNLVFVCADGAGGSLVLKQALPYVRLVGPDWPMTEERATREAAALRAHSALSDNVCRLIDFDPERYVLALEDLSDHEVFRTRLNAEGPHEGVAERLGEYVADVAFGTSFLALGEEEFRLRAAAAANPELCAITEDLIFTEPYLGAQRNSVRPAVEPVLAGLQADSDWVEAAMAMKHRFLTAGESLIHGDLHTGSVFVRGSGTQLSVKTFDAEFACYGPVGFDLGMMWANMFFAGARAAALGRQARAEGLYRTVESSWDTFAARMWQLWPRRRSPEKYPDSFLSGWLRVILQDGFGFAGCEAARRTIGLAKVSDLESLDDDAYTAAATAMLQLGRALLVDRMTMTFDRLLHPHLSGASAAL